jgi:oligopeptidase B
MIIIGGVINMRPELFKAVVLHFPFLDVLTSMLDEK